jgi:small-conductance mechanosensitive channel
MTMDSQDTFRDQVMNSLDSMWGHLAQYLPTLLGAIALLVVGYLVARLLSLLVRKGSKRLGIDRASRFAGVSALLPSTGGEQTVSGLLGVLAFWLVLLAFVISAANLLGLVGVAAAVNLLLTFLPRVVGALFVVLVGVLLARLAQRTIRAAGIVLHFEYANALAGVIYAILLVVTASLAIGQLGVATDLLNYLVAILFLTVGISVALAIGIGARDVAGQVIAGMYARELYQPGTTIEVSAVRGRLLEIATTNTLIETSDGSIACISNKDMLSAQVYSFKPEPPAR